MWLSRRIKLLLEHCIAVWYPLTRNPHGAATAIYISCKNIANIVRPCQNKQSIYCHRTPYATQSNIIEMNEYSNTEHRYEAFDCAWWNIKKNLKWFFFFLNKQNEYTHTNCLNILNPIFRTISHRWMPFLIRFFHLKRRAFTITYIFSLYSSAVCDAELFVKSFIVIEFDTQNRVCVVNSLYIRECVLYMSFCTYF